MVLIIILMGIGTKETGVLISKMELELTIILMEIFIKGNGSTVNLTAKETISITETKASIKETGKMARKKDLVN